MPAPLGAPRPRRRAAERVAPATGSSAPAAGPRTAGVLWRAVVYYGETEKRGATADASRVRSPRTGVARCGGGTPTAPSVTRPRLAQRGEGFSTHLAASREDDRGRRNVLIAGGGW